MKKRFFVVVFLTLVIFSPTLSNAEEWPPYDEVVYTCPDYAYPKMTFILGETRDPVRFKPLKLPGKRNEIGIPINLMWKKTDISKVKSAILEVKKGWTDRVAEWVEYVVDPITKEWIEDTPVAESTAGLDGGYHVLLFQLSNGNVVANAHLDAPVVRPEAAEPPVVKWAFGHVAVNFEGPEKLVGGFFAENKEKWSVIFGNPAKEKGLFLDNEIPLANPELKPRNNAWATLIQPKQAFGDFDPEWEETWIIEDGHYPIAGDRWLDKQMREEENQTTPT